MRLRNLLVVVALSSCTQALLQPQVAPETTLDDRLSVRGQVCTEKPDPSQFPVKIIFLIDSSGSMCVSDGPGSQASTGFCETIGAQLIAMGITTPGRVRALHSIIDRFKASSENNVFVALIPFDSKIANVYPDTGFVPASDGQLDTKIDALQNELGKGTDYQGAMAEAYSRIDADIQKSSRAQLPRTKYVVILLTDGSPYPRCTSDDNDADQTVYATADRPWGIWRDNPATFCNPVPDPQDPNGSGTDPNKTCGCDPSKAGCSHCSSSTDCGGNPCTNSVIPDFSAGADRNQNYQIFDAADRLSALKDKYNVGEIRLHTILLFNKDAVTLCGQICLTDLYNGMASADDAEKVAAWTLTELAVKHGNGTFQEFQHQTDIQLGSLDYTSLASRFVAKTLLANNTAAFPGLDGPQLDSDGDGVPDNLDDAKVLGTNHLNTDSDGDGFPDAFELSHRSEGFDPMVPDPRGCKDFSGFTHQFSCVDTDGDGLSEAAEHYLGTDPTMADSDADGIPDGMEVMMGLDPLVPNDRLLDHDLDGVPDVLEIFQHTNPLIDDRAVHARDAYRYLMTAVPQDDGRVCYDFVVSNIRLMTPDRASGQHGFNFISLNFAEAPETGVTRDYGLWKFACVFAQFAPPSVRLPEGPEIVLTKDDWRLLQNVTTPQGSVVPTNYQQLCKGVLP